MPLFPRFNFQVTHVEWKHTLSSRVPSLSDCLSAKPPITLHPFPTHIPVAQVAALGSVDWNRCRTVGPRTEKQLHAQVINRTRHLNNSPCSPLDHHPLLKPLCGLEGNVGVFRERFDHCSRLHHLRSVRQSSRRLRGPCRKRGWRGCMLCVFLICVVHEAEMEFHVLSKYFRACII